MNTSSITIHFRKISVGSKMLVECIICFVKLEETSTFTSTSLQSVPTTPEA